LTLSVTSAPAQLRDAAADLAGAHRTAASGAPGLSWACVPIRSLSAAMGPDAGHGGVFQNHAGFVSRALEFLAR
jgi:hypothetical protein